ncbi:PE/PPE C-terminal domain-containing protein [Mycobacterium sp.]|uniref:PE/PPE C-terminal domain-containing protein n=1 Tax=Mycobacterium sp. TaxID=1785 RepID=UPI003C75B3FB
MTNLLNGLAPPAQAVQGAAQAAGSALLNVGANAAANLGGSIGGVAAGLGKAVPLGGLSVPAAWTTSATSGAPGTTSVAVATLTNATTAPAVANGAAGSVPAAPPFGQFVNSGRGRKLPSYGFRLTFMTKPPRPASNRTSPRLWLTRLT